MKIYRSMTPDIDGLPLMGRSARKLGVRTLDWLPNNDVNATMPDDVIEPGEGMSAVPNDPSNLPNNRRPPQVNGGLGKDPVWEIDTGDLGVTLDYVQDRPTHGVVCPKLPMKLVEFEQALVATRKYWVRVIG